MSSKDFASMVTWHHTSPLCKGLAIWQQMTHTVLNIFFHWFPLICTSIVFRDRAIVMSQSLLFSKPITNSLSNRCRSPSNSATTPQNLKIIINSNRVLYFSLIVHLFCQVLQSLLASSCGMTRKQQLKHSFYWLHNRTNLTLTGTCNLLLIALKCDNIIANGWLLDCCYFALHILFSMLSKS